MISKECHIIRDLKKMFPEEYKMYYESDDVKFTSNLNSSFDDGSEVDKLS